MNIKIKIIIKKVFWKEYDRCEGQERDISCWEKRKDFFIFKNLFLLLIFIR